MKRYNSLVLGLVVLVLAGGLQTAWCQSCTPPDIVSHENGDTVYYGSQVTVRATGGVGTLTWSGGTFNPATGSEVTWTVPTSGSTAVITVTDAIMQSDSVTLNLAGRLYVDKDRPGDDGHDWEHAFKHLQDALAAAGPGCQIWVADGTYRPDEDKDHPTGNPGEQWRMFTLLTDVAIYGGFQGYSRPGGGETDLGQRNWVAYPAILSGDLDESSTHTSADSYHVVYAYNVTGAVLDGFTITMGYAPQSDGVGMYNMGSGAACTPTVANCVFQDNYSTGDDADGAAMHNWHASPTVTNCIFIHNIAGDDGGALCNKNGSNGTFTNCAFYNNETLGYEDSHGGAIFNTKGEGYGYVGSTPTFINCVVANNLTRKTGSKGGDGGGAADQDSGTSVTWTNCTFYGNTAQDDGGGLASRDGGASTVKNCIFWANTAGGNGSQLWQGGTPSGTATVNYCDVQGGWGTGTGNIADDPKFFSTTDLDGVDDRFLTMDDGLGIDLGSPCIDTATSTGAPAFDATGRTRPLDGDGNGSALYDRGAYECLRITPRKGPYLIYPPGQTDGMMVLWQLNQTQPCLLEWTSTGSYGSAGTATEENGNGADQHQHIYGITGLQPNTLYQYRIRGMASGSFRTAPLSSATQVKFFAYGDTRTYPANQNLVCNRMVAKYTADPDFQTFVLHVGDFVEHGMVEADWDNQFFPASQPKILELQAHLPLMGCQGNHENNNASGTYTELSFSATKMAKYWPYGSGEWYSFDYGPVHVVEIHEYERAQSEGDSGLSGTDLNAVKNDLLASRNAGKWNVLVCHAPGYSAGDGHANNGNMASQLGTDATGRTLHKLVDIVFAGHNHYYARCEIHGVPHITAGRAGAPNHNPIAPPGDASHPGIRKTDTALHHCEITINGNTMNLKAVRADGSTIESIDIPKTRKFRVETGSDDAEEKLSTHAMDLTSSDLEMVDDTEYSGWQTVGMRFQSLDLPQGANLTKAYVRFTAKNDKSGTCNLTFWGQDADDAGTFTTATSNISSRTQTSASASWSPGSWTDRFAYDTPDISAVLEEILGRAGWTSGNDMALIVTGPDNHERRAYSYNGDTALVPVLLIEY
jgi:hypothetical protein